MLASELKTTPLFEAGERETPALHPVTKPQWWRIFWILGRVLDLLFRSVRDRIQQKPNQHTQAKEIRQLFERLGGMWIKLGQVLAMRTDLFSRDFCRELSQLQDRAQAFDPELSRRIIERELGYPLEFYFDLFEPYPFAAASLSQVHRARLIENGMDVVVKVQRPYIKEYFHYDFAWLRFFFRLLGKAKRLKHYQLSEMLREVQVMMEEEVEYRQEASNMVLLKKYLDEHNVYVPEVFVELTTERVLVMEYIDGVFMSDLNTMLREDPIRAELWLSENDIDRRAVASKLLNTVFRQLFEDLHFHGDLHFGNIILLRGSELALIDFGSVGRLDPKFAAQYNQYFRAVSREEFDRAADLLLLTLGELPAINIVKLKARIIRVLNKQALQSAMQKLPYHQKSIGKSSSELSRVMAEFRISVNWQYLKMARAFETLDQNISLLNPEFDFVSEMGAYIHSRTRRARRQSFDGLPDLISDIGFWKLFITPTLLRRGLFFEHRPPLVTRAAAASLRGMATVIVVLLAFVAWLYLGPQHAHLLAALQPLARWYTAWVAPASTERYVAFALFALLLLGTLRLRRLAATLSRHKVRLP